MLLHQNCKLRKFPLIPCKAPISFLTRALRWFYPFITFDTLDFIVQQKRLFHISRTIRSLIARLRHGVKKVHDEEVNTTR